MPDPFQSLPAPAVTRPFEPLVPGAVPDRLPTGERANTVGELFRRAITETSDLQVEAESAIEAFVRGDDVEIHQVMAAVEEAQIALELLTEGRNRLVDAYRTLVNMQ